mmetsp:Transcript_51584/g.95464  ORF Transcript_51584/g.95464 Transcript_51584/m.95464 type:complete len:240 (-) Transcript_51584:120-839(-)
MPQGPGPTYLNHMDISAIDWDKLAAGHEQRTTLRLRYLPSRLCSVEALRRVLHEVGLDGQVDTIRVFSQEAGMGVALVNAVDADGVARLTRFFHGRTWGRGPPVAVAFSVVQGREEVLAAYPDEVKAGPCSSVAARPKWRSEVKVIDLDVCKLRQPQSFPKRQPTSEASTEIDESEVKSSSASDVPNNSTYPMLPPGLEDIGFRGFSPVQDERADALYASRVVPRHLTVGAPPGLFPLA